MTDPAPAQLSPAPRLSVARTLLLAGVLVGAILAAYHNSLEGPFIFDDEGSIPQNPNITQLWPLTRSMSAAPLSGVAGRPMVSLSLAVNYAIGGLDVTGYHVLNLAIHAIAALFLLGVVRRTLRLPGLTERFGRDADLVALAVALLWAVHPLVTESVTYVIQRTESLMGMFFLATIYCFLRGATSSSRRATMAWHVCATLACAAGMGSKEVMVAAPILVLLYDRLFFAGSFRNAFRQRPGVHAALFLTIAIVPALLFTSVALRSKTGGGHETLTMWENLKTQSAVITHYLRLALWPNALCIDYDDWPIARRLTDVLPQALLVVALLFLTAYGFSRASRVAFLGAWFFVILAPTSSFLPLGTEIAGERRMYLPTVAVVAAVVLGVAWVLRTTGERFGWQRSSRSLVGVVMLVAVASALVVATVARNAQYARAVTIYGDAVAKRPNNARATMNWGIALMAEGRLDEARDAFRRAITARPTYADTYYNLAALDLVEGRAEAAAVNYSTTIRHRPGWPLPYMRLGDLLAQQGHAAQARVMYDQARSLASRAQLELLVQEADAKIAALPAATGSAAGAGTQAPG